VVRVSCRAPGFTQEVGAGKAELSIVPAGWVSIAQANAPSEPAFGEYFVGGGTITFARCTWWALEGELLAGLPTGSQELAIRFEATPATTSPPVFMDAVESRHPVHRGQRPLVPLCGRGHWRDHHHTEKRARRQAERKPFTATSADGLKFYSTGRWGYRVDSAIFLIRSEPQAPGTFFGREQRRAQTLYGSMVLK